MKNIFLAFFLFLFLPSASFAFSKKEAIYQNGSPLHEWTLKAGHHISWMECATGGNGSKVAKTIKSQPPHTGTLKKTRGVFDELAGAASKGRKPGMYGPKETTNILMKGTPGRGPHTGKMQKLHDIVSKSGKLAQELKKHKK